MKDLKAAIISFLIAFGCLLSYLFLCVSDKSWSEESMRMTTNTLGGVIVAIISWMAIFFHLKKRCEDTQDN
ncbi:hypothetical protein V6R21_19250 [Limibacter armeniacum]|uniref:hypothetical protein n=1 Tax=Limibacter armeniacum TaxID=466084 RepID=UPI002FE617CE